MTTNSMQKAFIDGWNEGAAKVNHDQHIMNIAMGAFVAFAVVSMIGFFIWDAIDTYRSNKRNLTA